MNLENSASTPEPATRSHAGRWIARALAALALLGAGLVGGVVWGDRLTPWLPDGQTLRRERATPVAAPADPGAPGAPASSAATDDEPVEVTLTAEAVARAGIKSVVARSERVSIGVTVPGTVFADAYRDTKVSALVGGVVRQVGVELGQTVTRGQRLAVVASSDLADAQMKLLSMRAMLAADHQKLRRVEQLVAIGAASRQELEEVTATHHAHETEVAAARQRLLVLGLSAEQIDAVRDASHIVSDVAVRAPSDGSLVARSVNAGQVVAAGQELFGVADLSTVWVIGDLYETDAALVRVGSPAAVTMPAQSLSPVRGRVTYVDPRVDPSTRTARVRVEVPNVDGQLRLGMYVSVRVEAAGAERRTVIPQHAVQRIGDRAVVFVPASDGEPRFVERRVQLGLGTGELVQILRGIEPGERVVTDGSFLLRAEAAKLRPGG